MLKVAAGGGKRGNIQNRWLEGVAPALDKIGQGEVGDSSGECILEALRC